MMDKLVEELQKALRRYEIVGTREEKNEEAFHAPWFLVDTSAAEPDVNWLGELVAEGNDRGLLEKRMWRLIVESFLVVAAPAFSPTHIHKKRGTKYQVLATDAGLQTQWAQTFYDGHRMEGHPIEEVAFTVYVGEDGRHWVRSTAEFNDGRFEEIKE